MKIFLIGYMGCGKSSLGRRLAKRAGMRFVDMDSEIEQREPFFTVRTSGMA